MSQLTRFQQKSNIVKSENLVEDMSKRGEYIPSIQLIQSSSDALTDVKLSQIVRIGDFLFNQSESLGRSFDAVPCGWRPHAMELDNKKTVIRDTYVEDDIYKDIREKCDKKVQNYLAGIDFLLWLPAKKNFGIYFLYKTHLKSAGMDLNGSNGKLVTIQSKLVEWNNYKWQTPNVVPSTNEIIEPTEEQVDKAIEMFNNPKTAVGSVSSTVASETETGRPR